MITGSAVALHCCKSHAKINRKIENLTPCEIVTHEYFNLKLGTCDYVVDITHRATFVSNWLIRDFLPNRWNITLLWLFVALSTFFFVTRPAWTIAPIVTLYSSNDMFPPEDGPFGGQDDGWRQMGKICPKNSSKCNPKHQNLFIAISRELLIQQTSNLRTEFRPWKALHGLSAINTTWLMAAMLKIGGGSIWTKFGSRMQNNTPVTVKQQRSKPE